MFRTIITSSTVFAIVLTGCVVNDDVSGNDESTGEETGDPPTTTAPTTTAPTTTTPTTDTDTTVGPTTDTDTTTMDPDSSSSTTEPEPGPFVFDETPFEDYAQVDRIGFPAINTGLNLLGDKDAYNQATPADDAGLMFISDILDSLHTLHVGIPGMEVYAVPEGMLADPIDASQYNTGLDDDIGAILAQDPRPFCIAPDHPVGGEMGDVSCVDQGASFAIPDVLVVDTDDAAAFPNGRQPTEPVIDIILAVLLIDLGDYPVTLFMDLDADGTLGPAVNPLENDVENPADFPYFAPAH